MTVIAERREVVSTQNRFFEISALLMALVLVGGFSLHLAAGRSSFGAPPIVHAHALIFFGWVVIYVAQTFLATRGGMATHRILGWIAAGWVVAMVAVALALMVFKVRSGTTPPVFQPQHFLIANPMTVLTFAGLTTTAVAMRRRTDWHRRLHLCAMVALLGPGFGRILPLPLLMPWGFQIAATIGLIFPVTGIALERRRTGRVHPAWWWGLGTLVAMLVLTEVIAASPLAGAIYRSIAAGSPGAEVAPLNFGLPY